MFISIEQDEVLHEVVGGWIKQTKIEDADAFYCFTEEGELVAMFLNNRRWAEMFLEIMFGPDPDDSLLHLFSVLSEREALLTGVFLGSLLIIGFVKVLAFVMGGL